MADKLWDTSGFEIGIGLRAPHLQYIFENEPDSDGGDSEDQSRPRLEAPDDRELNYRACRNRDT